MKLYKIAGICLLTLFIVTYVDAPIVHPDDAVSAQGRADDGLAEKLTIEPDTLVEASLHDIIMSDKSLYPLLLHHRLEHHAHATAVVAGLEAGIYAEASGWLETPEQKDALVIAVMRETQKYVEHFNNGIPRDELREDFVSNVVDAIKAVPTGTVIDLGTVEFNVGKLLETAKYIVNTVNIVGAKKNENRIKSERNIDAAVYLWKTEPLDTNKPYEWAIAMRNNHELAKRLHNLVLEPHDVVVLSNLHEKDSQLVKDPRYQRFQGSPNIVALRGLKKNILDLQNLPQPKPKLVDDCMATMTEIFTPLIAKVAEHDKEIKKLRKKQLKSSGESSESEELKEKEAEQVLLKRKANYVFRSTSEFLETLGKASGHPKLVAHAKTVGTLGKVFDLVMQGNMNIEKGGLLTAAATMNYAQGGLILVNMVMNLGKGGGQSREASLGKAIAELRKAMMKQFDDVKRKLDVLDLKSDEILFQTMKGFEAVSGELLNLANGQAVNFHTLRVTANDLRRFSDQNRVAFANLEEMVEDGFRRDFENAIDRYIHRYSVINRPVDESEFKQGIMLFRTYATKHAGDAIDLGPTRDTPHETSNREIAEWLARGQIYKHTDNIYRVLADLQALPDPGNRTSSFSRIKNLYTWLLATSGIRQILKLSGPLASSVRPSYFSPIISSGEEIQEALEEMYHPKTVEALVRNYVREYDSGARFLAALVSDFENRHLRGLRVEEKPTQQDFKNPVNLSVPESRVMVVGQEQTFDVWGFAKKCEMPQNKQECEAIESAIGELNEAFSECATGIIGDSCRDIQEKLTAKRMKIEPVLTISIPVRLKNGSKLRRLPVDMIEKALPASYAMYRKLIEAKGVGSSSIEWECKSEWTQVGPATKDITSSGSGGQLQSKLKGRVGVVLTGSLMLMNDEGKPEKKELIKFLYILDKLHDSYERSQIWERLERCFLCCSSSDDCAPEYLWLGNAVRNPKEKRHRDTKEILDEKWRELLSSSDFQEGPSRFVTELPDFRDFPPRRVRQHTIDYYPNDKWVVMSRFGGGVDFVELEVQKVWQEQVHLFIQDLKQIAVFAAGNRGYPHYRVLDHVRANQLLDALRGMRGAKVLLHRYLELVAADLVVAHPAIQQMLDFRGVFGKERLFDDLTIQNLAASILNDESRSDKEVITVLRENLKVENAHIIQTNVLNALSPVTNLSRDQINSLNPSLNHLRSVIDDLRVLRKTAQDPILSKRYRRLLTLGAFWQIMERPAASKELMHYDVFLKKFKSSVGLVEGITSSKEYRSRFINPHPPEVAVRYLAYHLLDQSLDPRQALALANLLKERGLKYVVRELIRMKNEKAPLSDMLIGRISRSNAFARSGPTIPAIPKDDSELLVTKAYCRLLNRSPTSSEVAAYSAALQAGDIGIKGLVLKLALSAERRMRFQEKAEGGELVELVFEHLLARTPNASELDYWTDVLHRQGMERIVRRIIESEEYTSWFGNERVPGQGRFGSAVPVPLRTYEIRPLVARVYGRFLGRTAPAAELNAWVRLLTSGSSTVRGLVRSVAVSELYADRWFKEGKADKGLTRLVKHLLDREVLAEEIEPWKIVLANEGLTALVDRIMNGHEYRKNFGEYKVPGKLRGSQVPSCGCMPPMPLNWGCPWSQCPSSSWPIAPHFLAR